MPLLPETGQRLAKQAAAQRRKKNDKERRMKKIATAGDMRRIDAVTIEEEGIASVDLMERAAASVVAFVERRWDADTPVVVFAGPGNNGGDALAAARMLAADGYDVSAYLFNVEGHLSADCETNRERLADSRVAFTEVSARFEPPQISADALVIDGLFGTGISRPLAGGFLSLVRFINSTEATVVSIDVPSGLMEEGFSEAAGHVAVRADYTCTFQLVKRSMLLADTAVFWGSVEVVDIGLSASAIAELDAQETLVEESDVKAMLLPRPAFGHKGTFGHALLVAGQYGMAGAAVLAARACLRSGVGKLTVHTPRLNNNILQIAVPEAVLSADVADEVFTRTPDAGRYDAVAVGPAIGRSQATAAALQTLILNCERPLLLDADALNVIAEHPGWLEQLPQGCVLTPHPGEMARLVHRDLDDASLLTAARRMAVEKKVCVVLKGHHTAVCRTDGSVVFNTTGNSGMATAGSGDVLSGVITALLAAHYAPEDAAVIGVFVHGLAGDMAAAELSEDALVASDIIAHLPAAFRRLRS